MPCVIETCASCHKNIEIPHATFLLESQAADFNEIEAIFKLNLNKEKYRKLNSFLEDVQSHPDTSRENKLWKFFFNQIKTKGYFPALIKDHFLYQEWQATIDFQNSSDNFELMKKIGVANDIDIDLDRTFFFNVVREKVHCYDCFLELMQGKVGFIENVMCFFPLIRNDVAKAKNVKHFSTKVTEILSDSFFELIEEEQVEVARHMIQPQHKCLQCNEVIECPSVFGRQTRGDLNILLDSISTNTKVHTSSWDAILLVKGVELKWFFTENISSDRLLDRKVENSFYLIKKPDTIHLLHATTDCQKVNFEEFEQIIFFEPVIPDVVPFLNRCLVNANKHINSSLTSIKVDHSTASDISFKSAPELSFFVDDTASFHEQLPHFMDIVTNISDNSFISSFTLDKESHDEVIRLNSTFSASLHSSLEVTQLARASSPSVKTPYPRRGLTNSSMLSSRSLNQSYRSARFVQEVFTPLKVACDISRLESSEVSEVNCLMGEAHAVAAKFIDQDLKKNALDESVLQISEITNIIIPIKKALHVAKLNRIDAAYLPPLEAAYQSSKKFVADSLQDLRAEATDEIYPKLKGMTRSVRKMYLDIQLAALSLAESKMMLAALKKSYYASESYVTDPNLNSQSVALESLGEVGELCDTIISKHNKTLNASLSEQIVMPLQRVSSYIRTHVNFDVPLRSIFDYGDCTHCRLPVDLPVFLTGARDISPRPRSLPETSVLPEDNSWFQSFDESMAEGQPKIAQFIRNLKSGSGFTKHDGQWFEAAQIHSYTSLQRYDEKTSVTRSKIAPFFMLQHKNNANDVFFFHTGHLNEKKVIDELMESYNCWHVKEFEPNEEGSTFNTSTSSSLDESSLMSNDGSPIVLSNIKPENIWSHHTLIRNIFFTNIYFEHEGDEGSWRASDNVAQFNYLLRKKYIFKQPKEIIPFINWDSLMQPLFLLQKENSNVSKGIKLEDFKIFNASEIIFKLKSYEDMTEIPRRFNYENFDYKITHYFWYVDCKRAFLDHNSTISLANISSRAPLTPMNLRRGSFSACLVPIAFSTPRAENRALTTAFDLSLIDVGSNTPNTQDQDETQPFIIEDEFFKYRAPTRNEQLKWYQKRKGQLVLLLSGLGILVATGSGVGIACAAGAFAACRRENSTASTIPTITTSSTTLRPTITTSSTTLRPTITTSSTTLRPTTTSPSPSSTARSTTLLPTTTQASTTTMTYVTYEPSTAMPTTTTGEPWSTLGTTATFPTTSTSRTTSSTTVAPTFPTTSTSTTTSSTTVAPTFPSTSTSTTTTSSTAAPTFPTTPPSPTWTTVTLPTLPPFEVRNTPLSEDLKNTWAVLRQYKRVSKKAGWWDTLGTMMVGEDHYRDGLSIKPFYGPFMVHEWQSFLSGLNELCGQDCEHDRKGVIAILKNLDKGSDTQGRCPASWYFMKDIRAVRNDGSGPSSLAMLVAHLIENGAVLYQTQW